MATVHAEIDWDDESWVEELIPDLAPVVFGLEDQEILDEMHEMQRLHAAGMLEVR